MSLLETSLEFFTIATFYLFFKWLDTGKDRIILACGLALGLAFLTKYQALAAGLVILISLPILFYSGKSKAKLSKFWLFIVAAAAIMMPLVVSVAVSGGLGRWLSLLQINSAQANDYSARFAEPIFYLIEITFPGMQFVHPITIAVFVLGSLGLVLFVWRRKPQDKFLLVWLVVVYVFFTLIASRTWRYAFPLFPVVAVAGAVFVSSGYDRLENYWKSASFSVRRRWVAKVLAGCLIVVTASAIVYSVIDAETWVANESVYLPTPEAINFVAERINATDSLLILCPINHLNVNVAKFYLNANDGKNNTIWQYPILPPDSFPLNMNITELTVYCQEKNAKYMLLDDNTGYFYFNSTIRAQDLAAAVVADGSFTGVATFGTAPYRIFVFQTNQKS